MKFTKSFPLVIKNYGFSLITDGFVRLGNALVIIFVSRFLGVSASGSINIALTYLYLGSFLAYWGFGNLMVREVAKDQKVFAKYFSNYALLRTLLGIISAIFVSGIALSSRNYSSETRNVILIFAISLPVNSLYMLCQSAFIAFEKLKFNSLISIVIALLRITGSYLIIQYGYTPLILLSWYHFLVSFITLVMYVIMMKRYLPSGLAVLDKDFLIKETRTAFPFFFLAIFLALDNKVDVIILSFLMNEESVGYYGAMATILGLFYLIPEAFRNAIFPALARYSQMGLDLLSTRFNQILKYALVFAIPLSMIGFMSAKPLVSILFGNSYALSANLLGITAWSVISYCVIIIVTRLLMVLGKEKKVLFATMASMFLTVLLNLAAINFCGLQGASWVKLITSIILMVFFLLETHKSGITILSGNWISKFLVAGLSTVLPMGFFQKLSVGTQALIAMIIYCVVILALRVVTLAEVVKLFTPLEGLKETHNDIA